MNEQRILTVETVIKTPIGKVWELWTKPEHIMKWAFASLAWEAPYAENDVTLRGKFKIVMSAKDKSASFDFTGVYTDVKTNELIEYDIDDGRHVKVKFEELLDGTRVIETFEPEKINPEDKQTSGWQAILDNFKKYAETNA